MSSENRKGYVIRYDNDPKYKGCDEYILDETSGVRTNDINEAYVFPTLVVAKTYEQAKYKGMVPKAHLPAKFVKVERQISIRTVVL